jgi:hypothetical protein
MRFHLIKKPWLHIERTIFKISNGRLAAADIHHYAVVSKTGESTDYGMTIQNEQRYFQWYAKEIYRGNGAIVDLGCWLGSTTIPLARGLRQNERVKSDAKIYAYDLFQWESWMNGMKNDFTSHLKPGDDFTEVFRKITSPYAANIEVEKADLTKYIWNKGAIEFLLVDAMKSETLAEHISKTFYPYLIPGQSYVLHQDFAHYYTPWIHLLQYNLRDYFKFVCHVYNSPSVVLELVKPVPDTLLNQKYSLADFDEDFVFDAFEYSLGMVSGHQRSNVAAAHCMFYVHRGQEDVAKKLIQSYLLRGFSPYSELGIVIRLLE